MVFHTVEPPPSDYDPPPEWVDESEPRHRNMDAMLLLEERAEKRGNWFAFASIYDGFDFSDEEVTR